MPSRAQSDSEALSSSLGLLAAFSGGVVSFASPCVLPLLPAYLSTVTGLELPELSGVTGRQLTAVMRSTGAFVLGFGAVFVLLGLSATAVGHALLADRTVLSEISGWLVVAMAIFLAGSQLVRAPRLYGEFRFHPRLARFGPIGSLVAGAAFGLGWTPCIGPVLGSVLAVAAASGNLGEGIGLLVAYTLGLGLPFLLSGLALAKVTTLLETVKRHLRGITLFSAALLGVFGLLLAFDQLTWVTANLQSALQAVGLGGLANLG